uniref:hypothetical protein n=1 Tax=Pseudomonas sp. BF-RE-03 TaxID=2832359 RepID=UPI001CC11361
FAHLREAQSLDDNLPYDEPWGWMQPVRHALGALLLEQDRSEGMASLSEPPYVRGAGAWLLGASPSDPP